MFGIPDTTDDVVDSNNQPVISQFGLEAEVAHLKDELKKARLKLSRQRRELKRLNRGYTLLLHAAKRSKWLKSAGLVPTSETMRDVNGNTMVDAPQ